MDSFLVIKLLHILAFVYWLGGDLGTFYASQFVTRDDLSPETRNIALTIMMGCDQAPRFSMPLIFPLGLQLTYDLGLTDISATWVMAAWLICIAWVIMVATIHFAHGKSFVPALTQVDFYFRIAMIISLVGISAYALQTASIFPDAWVAYKVIVFGLLVACGLFIRIGLKPFIAAWGNLMTNGPTPEGDAIIKKSISSVRPFVYAIWVGLLINAALGLHLI